MAMNFNQMLKFQQIKNAFKRFDQDHPKFKNFMNAVWREQALKQDAVMSQLKKKASQISRLTFLIFTVILPQTPDFSCF